MRSMNDAMACDATMFMLMLILHTKDQYRTHQVSTMHVTVFIKFCFDSISRNASRPESSQIMRDYK